MPTLPYCQQTSNMRTLLSAVGVGEFNATMIIPYMFLAPATTDPMMAQIIMLVEHLQEKLGCRVTGQLDVPTAAKLHQLIGPNWPKVAWGEIVEGVIARGRLIPPKPSRGRAQAIGFLPDLPILPQIPGGTFTYLALGIGAWWIFKKKRK